MDEELEGKWLRKMWRKMRIRVRNRGEGGEDADEGGCGG